MRQMRFALLVWIITALVISTSAYAQTDRKTDPERAKLEQHQLRSGNPQTPAALNQEQSGSKAAASRHHETVIMPDDPTFPKYINTGNPEADEANYQLRKAEWYDKYVINLNERSKSERARMIRKAEIDQQFARDNAKMAGSAPAERVKIEDIIISDKSAVGSRVDGFNYMTIDQFRSLPAGQQEEILSNHHMYKIVSHEDLIPKIVVSKSEFNSLPADKQQSMMNSNHYIVK